MARLGPLSVKGRVGRVGVGVRVLQLRMYESKDVGMKGLSQTLLLQKLLSRPLNAFALGLRPQTVTLVPPMRIIPTNHATPLFVSTGRT